MGRGSLIQAGFSFYDPSYIESRKIYPDSLIQMNILIIGGGSMGQAFARGLSSSGHTCAVIEKDVINAQKSENLQVRVIPQLVDVQNDLQWANPDAAIIAVKPIDVDNVCEGIRKVINKKCLIISIAAGVTISTLNGLLEGYQIVRSMPNLAASELMSATAMCISDQLSEQNVQNARDVLEVLGTVVRVDEAQMNLVTAISGSGPAYFFYLAEQMTQFAVDNGMDAEIAHQLITQTFIGSAKVAQHDGSFAQLRTVVTSKGGTTEAAIETFEDLAVGQNIRHGINAALTRGKQLNDPPSQQQ